MGLFGLGKRRVVEPFFVNSYGNDQTRGVYTFQMDVDNGEILFKKHFKTPSDPVFSFKFGRFVCTAYKNRTGTGADGGICSYASTQELLALVSRVSDEGRTYVHACTDGDDETAKFLYAVDYYNSEVASFNIKKKKLVRLVSKHKFTGSSVHPTRQTISHPSYVGFTPDGVKLFVVDLGQDKVFFFDTDGHGEMILDNELTLDIEAGSGPKKLIFNDQGNRAYVLNELSNNVMVYRYENYKFELIQTIDTYPSEDEDYESLATQMKFDEQQKHLYVTNRGHDSLSLFNVLEDGTLEFREFADTSPNPVDFEIFKDRWIAVVCQKGGIVESYQFVPEKNGMLFETKYSYLVSEPVNITKFNTDY